MGDNSNGRIGRRKMLQSLGAGTAAGLAGCSSFLKESSEDDSSKKELVMGTHDEILTFNLLKSAGPSLMYHQWYDTGIEVSPAPYTEVPWAFEDYTFRPEKIGTGDPALSVTVQEGLTWQDGPKVTAEDVAFTIDYIQEQEPTGVIRAKDFETVEDVTYDKPSSRTAHLFLSEPYALWLDYIVGTAILPKHQWKDISDYFQWEPETPDDVVGSSVLEVVDWEIGDYVQYDLRPADEIPWLDEERIYWMTSDEPYLDSVRFKFFESHHQMHHALIRGDIDLIGHGMPYSEMQEVANKSNALIEEVWQSGYDFHAFNLRRVPFDDRPFRQLMAILTDYDSIQETFDNRVTRGTYPVLQQNSDYFPPNPYTIDEFEGIPVPDYRFPGQRGAWELDEEAIQTAREHLLEADGKYDYSFEEAVTDYSAAPDGKELYVDGEPLSEAHTNNDGEPGQGPVEMLYRNKDGEKKVTIIQNWVEALRKVGVPVEESVIPFPEQKRRLVNQEQFDMATASWHGLSLPNYFNTLYGGHKTDLDSSENKPRFNFMGYTGADEHLAEHRKTLDEDKQKKMIKKVLAQLWYDLPLMSLYQERLYLAASPEYRGYSENEATYHSKGTWLNVEPR